MSYVFCARVNSFPLIPDCHIIKICDLHVFLPLLSLFLIIHPFERFSSFMRFHDNIGYFGFQNKYCETRLSSKKVWERLKAQAAAGTNERSSYESYSLLPFHKKKTRFTEKEEEEEKSSRALFDTQGRLRQRGRVTRGMAFPPSQFSGDGKLLVSALLKLV